MRQRVVCVVVASALLVAAGGAGVDASTAVPNPPATAPSSMSSLGDSITRAFNACGWFFDCTGRSWASGGSNDKVSSHYERLRSLRTLTAHNDARTGAKVGELPQQAATAVGRGVGYVTVLIGANDACTSTESGMTSVAAFESSFRSAMSTLAGANTKVFVSSIPDIYRLWQAGKGSRSARSAWSSYGICQSMLKNPTSTTSTDEARRQRVRQRVIDFNAVLVRVCEEHGAICDHDEGTVFAYPFQLSQLSTWDYFHPNEAGQAVLAAETWKAGFSWSR